MSSAQSTAPSPVEARPAPIRSRRVVVLCVVMALAMLPLVFTDAYWRTNLIICALNVMLAIGLDFVLGYAGQLNLPDMFTRLMLSVVATCRFWVISLTLWA